MYFLTCGAECHGFVCDSPEEAILVAANLYQETDNQTKPAMGRPILFFENFIFIKLLWYLELHYFHTLFIFHILFCKTYFMP